MSFDKSVSETRMIFFNSLLTNGALLIDRLPDDIQDASESSTTDRDL